MQENLVAVGLDIDDVCASTRRPSPLVPRHNLTARLTRWIRIVGRAPANMRVEQLRELRKVSRFERHSNPLGQDLDVWVFDRHP